MFGPGMWKEFKTITIIKILDVKNPNFSLYFLYVPS